MKPTTMLYRNLMSMDVEECIRAYPIDAVVLLGGCDKTVPAQLMGPRAPTSQQSCYGWPFGASDVSRSVARSRYRSLGLRR